MMDTKRIEQSIAQKVGGRRHKRSGGLGKKGDVSDEYFMYEVKATKKKSFRITQEMLNKISRESIGRGKEPAIVVVWDNDGLIDKEWVLLPLRLMNGLKNRGLDVVGRCNKTN